MSISILKNPFKRNMNLHFLSSTTSSATSGTTVNGTSATATSTNTVSNPSTSTSTNNNMNTNTVGGRSFGFMSLYNNSFINKVSRSLFGFRQNKTNTNYNDMSQSNNSISKINSIINKNMAGGMERFEKIVKEFERFLNVLLFNLSQPEILLTNLSLLSL